MMGAERKLQSNNAKENTPMKEQIAGQINKKRKYDEFKKGEEEIPASVGVVSNILECQIYKYFRKNG